MLKKNKDIKKDFYVLDLMGNQKAKVIKATAKEINKSKDYFVCLPNTFFPETEILSVTGNGIKSFRLTIYGRWENKVFETTSLKKGWDGTYCDHKLDSAACTYYIEATFTNGQSIAEKGKLEIVN